MLNVPDANKYSSNAFRYGHAQQMVSDGARLCEILAAGDWKSAAFLCYQDRCKLEHDAVLEAHGGAQEESSSSESDSSSGSSSSQSDESSSDDE